MRGLNAAEGFYLALILPRSSSDGGHEQQRGVTQRVSEKSGRGNPKP